MALLWDQFWLMGDRLVRAVSEPTDDPFAICFVALVLVELAYRAEILRTLYRFRQKTGYKAPSTLQTVLVLGVFAKLTVDLIWVVEPAASITRHESVLMLWISWLLCAALYIARFQMNMSEAQTYAAKAWGFRGVIFLLLLLLDQFYSPEPALPTKSFVCYLAAIAFMAVASFTTPTNTDGLPGCLWQRTLLPIQTQNGRVAELPLSDGPKGRASPDRN